MKFSDIPQMTRSAAYRVHVAWASIERWIADMSGDYGVDLSPDYQRDHVWTEDQASRYVEWVLRGGKSGLELQFNCLDWDRPVERPRPLELVDGKQRLKAVRDFMGGRLRAFGRFVHEFDDKLRSTTGPVFIVHVNNLQTRAEVMQWYVDMNAGGTIHSGAEIARVRELIVAATKPAE